MLVNGIEYSWSNAVFTVAGNVIAGISEIEYSDELEKVHNWGAGSAPVSRSYGKYEAKGSITLHSSEVERLTRVAPGGDIKAIPPFDITVTFAAQLGQLPVRHKLRSCEFMNNMRGMKQGDEKFDVKLDLIIAEIAWL
ncbi:hypothetical protein [Hymenobacter terrenus]|uniref:hypothetical protein n=1 Tax=Hymenobacter terrenus TaxID=1629124 RepID=UPI000619D3B9|nr:hypothetical protein [Hymenobacter terrenus]